LLSGSAEEFWTVPERAGLERLFLIE